MYKFFERHKKTIIWSIVIAFLIGGVGLIGLNQAARLGAHRALIKRLAQRQR